jgi:hypothetical protein
MSGNDGGREPAGEFQYSNDAIRPDLCTYRLRLAPLIDER